MFIDQCGPDHRTFAVGGIHFDASHPQHVNIEFNVVVDYLFGFPEVVRHPMERVSIAADVVIFRVTSGRHVN